MHSKQINSSEPFSIQGLQVSPLSGQISGPQGSVRLEPRVMSLLLVLASRPGELVSRTELLTDIWPGEGVYDEALTQCVYQLRHQLGEAGGGEEFRQLVKTVPKRGYVLQGEVLPLDTTAVNDTLSLPFIDTAPVNGDSAPVPQDRRNWKSAAAVLILLVVMVGAVGW